MRNLFDTNITLYCIIVTNSVTFFSCVQRIRHEMSSLAKMDHSQYDCCVVIILSHGTEVNLALYILTKKSEFGCFALYVKAISQIEKNILVFSNMTNLICFLILHCCIMLLYLHSVSVTKISCFIRLLFLFFFLPYVLCSGKPQSFPRSGPWCGWRSRPSSNNHKLPKWPQLSLLTGQA